METLLRPQTSSSPFHDSLVSFKGVKRTLLKIWCFQIMSRHPTQGLLCTYFVTTKGGTITFTALRRCQSYKEGSLNRTQGGGGGGGGRSHGGAPVSTMSDLQVSLMRGCGDRGRSDWWNPGHGRVPAAHACNLTPESPLPAELACLRASV